MGWFSSPNDVIFWLDGTWCFRHEFANVVGHMSDDFRILREGDCGWCEITLGNLSVLSLPPSTVVA